MLLHSLPWPSHRRWITAILFCALLIFFLATQHETILTSSTFNKYSRPSNELLDKQGAFWKAFRADLDEYGPKTPHLSHPEYTKLDIVFNSSIQRKRPDFIRMSIKQWEALGKSHTSFIEKIRARDYQLPYNASTRGIVTTAGGPYLPVALVSIRMLRETGSILPVEVFLSNWSEWDPLICGKILPTLNAKCLVLQDVFDHDRQTRKHGLDKYQYKIMAILFSSFEDVLFLDSDCFPIRKPNELFDSEPFSSTGLVLWPDFWYPSESPLFFEIAGVKAPKLWERASTEAGEILYSKRKHELSLLLAAYYNYYGPNYYYPLQGQGAPGEGDKESFLWSAVALDEPYYTVKHPVHALGYKTKNGLWRGSAMAQFDPIADAHPDPQAQQISHTLLAAYPRPFFIHANFPKLDPAQIFNPQSFGATGPTKDSDQNMRRVWHGGEDEAVAFFGWDVERTVWRVVRDLACEYEGRIRSWEGKRGVCKKATMYWEAVFGG